MKIMNPIMNRIRIVIHGDENDNACTIVAGYYKFGWETFIGGTFGTTGTSILEITDEPDDSDILCKP